MISEISSSDLKVKIRHAGAELFSVTNSEGLEFIWQGDKSVWPRHAPVLFPIVGRLRNDKYSFGGKDYHLPQHGFARDMDFTPEHCTGSSCTFALHSNEETLKKFPFIFSLYISYNLSGNRLQCDYRIVNKGKSEMLFSIGAHPGFNCPLLPHEKFEDYYLEFEMADPEIRVLEGGLRGNNRKKLHTSDKKLSLTPGLFDEDALIFENRQINKVALRSEKSSQTIVCESSNWPYFGIWSKKGCDKFICLEPWWGITDAVNSSGRLEEKEGIIKLEPSAEFSCTYFLSFG